MFVWFYHVIILLSQLLFIFHQLNWTKMFPATESMLHENINWGFKFIYLQSKGPLYKNLIILYVIFEDVTSTPSVWELWGTMVKFWNNQAGVKDICSNQDANDEYLLNVTFIRGFRSFIRCVLVAIGHQY